MQWFQLTADIDNPTQANQLASKTFIFSTISYYFISLTRTHSSLREDLGYILSHLTIIKRLLFNYYIVQIKNPIWQHKHLREIDYKWNISEHVARLITVTIKYKLSDIAALCDPSPKHTATRTGWWFEQDSCSTVLLCPMTSFCILTLHRSLFQVCRYTCIALLPDKRNLSLSLFSVGCIRSFICSFVTAVSFAFFLVCAVSNSFLSLQLSGAYLPVLLGLEPTSPGVK